jgi:hypothetical protein
MWPDACLAMEVRVRVWSAELYTGNTHRSTDITDDILIIFYAKSLFRFDNGLHFLPATYLQLFNHTLQLVFCDGV